MVPRINTPSLRLGTRSDELKWVLRLTRSRALPGGEDELLEFMSAGGGC